MGSTWRMGLHLVGSHCIDNGRNPEGSLNITEQLVQEVLARHSVSCNTVKLNNDNFSSLQIFAGSV